ncbi:MAG: fused MFS/spermidine synthase, partial [Chloroflexota bacterium]
MATTTQTDASEERRTAARPAALYGVLLFMVFLAVYFLSGASALIYEVVWTRLLSLVFGVTLHAISAVLASFMAGLALGSVVAGRLADRVRAPLLYYAVLEVAIAVLGLASLVAIRELTPTYLWLYKASGNSQEIAHGLRFALACAALLLPTAAMGATLPFIVRASLQLLPKVGENVSLLYATNTAGAAAGTILAGFFLVGQLGFQESVLVAAGLNVVAGVFALVLATLPSSRRLSSAPPPMAAVVSERPAERPNRESSVTATRLVLLAMFISGLCALAYEVVWFRILDLFLNGTVYAFSIMLGTFLVGLAVGSALIRTVIGSAWNWVLVLAMLQLLIGAQAISAEFLVGAVPAWRDGLSDNPALAPLMGRPVAAMAVACVAVLLPLAILLGMTFPVAAQALAGGRRSAGSLIGGLNASNTVGAIIGSLAGGFWLLPVLGSQRSLEALAVVNVALAAILFWAAVARRPWWRVAVPAFGLVLLVIGSAPNMVMDVYRGLFKGHEMIWFEEGLENTVSVQRHQDGYTVMYLNNRSQAFDAPAMVAYHELIGHLPMLLHPGPQDALVIGMGGGATPGAVSRYQATEIDVVELSPSVVRAATFFRHINNDLHDQSNVHITVDDGRNHMLLTDKRYDVITADVIQAHHAGSGNLYSREYYELAKGVLRDDGLMVQWVNPALP